MKKIVLNLIIAIILTMPIVFVYALAMPTTTIPETTANPFEVLKNIANWIFAVFMVIAGIIIVLAAFSFIFSGGDPEKVASARMYVLYALIGVAVALLSKGLMSFVETLVKK